MSDQTVSKPEIPASQLGVFRDIALKDLGQTIALIVGVAYVCGFIVVTAYLGKFGFREYAAFRMQYLIAGATVFLLAGLFAYFVTRNIGPDNTDIELYTKLIMPVGGDALKWSFLAVLYFFSEVAYNIVVCSVLSAALLFPAPDREGLALLGAIVAGGALIRFGMTSNARKPASRRVLFYVGTFNLDAVIAFLVWVKGPYVELSYFYCAVFVMWTAYENELKVTSSAKAVALYFSIVGMVAFSGVFGGFFYGQVRASVGGGAPVSVRILADWQKGPPELLDVLQRRDGSLTPVDLLAETETELLIGTGSSSGRYGELVRVKREFVKAILVYDTRIATQK